MPSPDETEEPPSESLGLLLALGALAITVTVLLLAMS
jgi:hypothetical protein